MIGTKIYKNDLSNYSNLAEWCNSNNASIEDKGNYYEVVAVVVSLEESKMQATANIKNKLATTDYKCLKFIDGELTAEEYAVTKAERNKLRELYNLVEAAKTIEEVNNILMQEQIDD